MKKIDRIAQTHKPLLRERYLRDGFAMGVVNEDGGVRLLVLELVPALGGLEVALEVRGLGIECGGRRRGHGRGARVTEIEGIVAAGSYSSSFSSSRALRFGEEREKG